jgi:hypothetical protein
MISRDGLAIMIFSCLLGLLFGCGIFTDTIEEAGDKGPLKINLISGNNQSTTVHSTLSQPLTVKILNRLDNPAAEVSVVFSLVEGAGTLAQQVVTSADDGLASNVLLVGGEIGAGSVEVTAAGAVDEEGQPRSVTFLFQTVAGDAAKLIKEEGDGQQVRAGQNLLPLTVLLLDAYNNPLSGATVSYTLGPDLLGQQTTDGQGRASATISADETAGSYNVVAAAQGLTSTFSYVSLPDYLNLTIGFIEGDIPVSCPLADKPAGQTLSEPIGVVLTDPYDNPVDGVDVTFAAAGSPVDTDAAVVPATVSSNSDGKAWTTVTSESDAGATATVISVNIPGEIEQTCTLNHL